MKKIFLGLLALAGMVAGFTLTSCGGGGSNAKLDINMESYTFGDPVSLQIELNQRQGYADYYSATFTIQNQSYSGSFAITSPTTLQDGKVVIKGTMQITADDWHQAQGWWAGGTGFVRTTDPGATASVVIAQQSFGLDTVIITTTLPDGTGTYSKTDQTEATPITSNDIITTGTCPYMRVLANKLSGNK